MNRIHKDLAIFFAAVCLGLGLVGCSDDGNSPPPNPCNQFSNWAPGEQTSYRFQEPGQTWRVDVSVSAMDSDNIYFAIDEHAEPGLVSQHYDISYPTSCVPILFISVSDRIILALGLHSAWGTIANSGSPDSFVVDACLSTTEETGIGDLPVTQCREHDQSTGALDYWDQTTYSGGGNVPGNGFISRRIRPDLGDPQVAILDSWNGL